MQTETNTVQACPVVRDVDGLPRSIEAELNTLHDGLRGLSSVLSALTGLDHLQGKGYILGTKQDLIIAMIDCHASAAARIIELWETMQAREVQA